MLSQEDKQEILREFPNIKLSYETIIHKKVYNYDIAFVIPEGKKCFAWFTSFKDKIVCLLFELDNKNKKEIKNIKIINCCFSDSLCYGTIFYGTLFYHLNNPFFSIEDIFMYKGNNISSLNINNKINKICHILKNDIKQLSYNNYFVVFGLPLIIKPNDNFDKSIQTVNYKLNVIKYCNYSNNKSYLLPINELNNLEEKLQFVQKVEQQNNKNIKNDNNKNRNKIFEVKPDIQNDIYHLHSLDDKQYIGLAAIPDYKTSIMMNKLFRIIKENIDLDALEESDDEEEFENSNIDKFVHLDKSYKMICNFNNKFKKWIPIKITE